MAGRVVMIGIMLAAYLLAAPRVVNGDGLGYLKAALAGTIYPGHVAYVPLLMAVARLVGATRPQALLWPARVLSAIAAATAALALAAVARRRGGEPAARATALGLLASWGTLAAGSDVESYAPALASLTLALYFADGAKPVASGLWAAAAALFHVENVAFAAPALLLLPRGRARFVLAWALPLLAGYGALVGSRGVAGLGGATHGLSYPLHPWTPLVAVYGACKALVYAPYPYEASWPRVLGCFAVGAAAAAALLATARRPLPRAATWAWLAPYSLVGLVFYASDAERWVFQLPLLWLAASARPRSATVIAIGLVAANAALWLPTARDERIRLRAEAAAQLVGDGDLVIGPGHGWDEYIGFFDGARVQTFPLIYWAGAVGRAQLPARLAQTVAQTRQQGHRVFLARLRDDGDPMGWKELRQFGVGPAEARALLPAGRAVAVGDELERWDP
jgi:hypothetical protein